MLGFTKLANLFTDVRRIGSGEGAGMKIVPLEGDRDIARGSYEEPVQRAFLSNIQSGDVVYDVGANVGFFSLLAARRVGPTGQVYAFEPVARNAAAVERSAGLNGFDTLKVFTRAVGATNGMADLNLAEHIGGAVLASVGAPPDKRETISVDIVTLDHMIREEGLRPPTLVKIDVEGAELDVIRGMKNTLAAHSPVLIIELDDATQAGIEQKTRELSDLLTEMRYGLSDLAPSYPEAGWWVAHFVSRSLAA